MTAGTNLLLAAQCALFYRGLRDAASPRTRMWKRFFQCLAVSTLAGAPKHAFSAYAGTPAHSAVVLTSNLAAGLSTYFAQRAALESGTLERGKRRWLGRLAGTQLVGFSLLILRRQPFVVVVANSGAGLALAAALEARSYRLGRRDSGWTVAGLAALVLPGLAYLAKFPARPNFNHNDLAHLLMMPALALLHRAARSTTPAPEFPAPAFTPPVDTSPNRGG